MIATTALLTAAIVLLLPSCHHEKGAEGNRATSPGIGTSAAELGVEEISVEGEIPRATPVRGLTAEQWVSGVPQATAADAAGPLGSQNVPDLIPAETVEAPAPVAPIGGAAPDAPAEVELPPLPEDPGQGINPLIGTLDPALSISERQRFRFGIDTSVVYDDNIFYSEDSPTEDFILSFAPWVAVELGDSREREANFIAARYQPNAKWFMENGDESAVDHRAEAEVQWRLKRMTAGFSTLFERLSEPTADVRARYDRNHYANAIRLAYDLSTKTQLEARMRSDVSDYGSSSDASVVLLDSEEWVGELALRYAYSDKTTIAVGYAAGTLDVSGASDTQTYQQAFAEVSWAATGKITVTGRVGAEYRDAGGSDEVTPVYEAEVAYQPRESTKLALRAYRRVEASAYLADQNFTSTGVSASVEQKLGRRFIAGIEGGYEKAQYEAVGAKAAAGSARDEDSFFVRPSLRYRLRDWLAFTLSMSTAIPHPTRAGLRSRTTRSARR
ncbi:MAG: outer membrane beta-barrel protein [Verrucomicrobiales bacterium]